MNMKLFCLPYAGASANIFLKWKVKLAPGIKLIPLEYPGRGKRFSTPLCDNITELVDDLYAQISNETGDYPFAFFGHSLGSLAAFELTHKLALLNQKLPVQLFLSGHNAPHYEEIDKEIYNLPEKEFIDEILSYGGTTPEVFASAELKALFLPILRADMKIADTYKFNKEREKLNVNFNAFYAKSDLLISSEGMAAWKECTNLGCRIFPFEGDHMYLLEKEKDIITVINQVLCAL